jgi:hypothetical protein
MIQWSVILIVLISSFSSFAEGNLSWSIIEINDIQTKEELLTDSQRSKQALIETDLSQLIYTTEVEGESNTGSGTIVTNDFNSIALLFYSSKGFSNNSWIKFYTKDYLFKICVLRI